MGMPDWWDERRLGLFVHTGLAAVPAWAPVGGHPERYRAHLGREGEAGTQPSVEVLAHHRDRWGHIEHFDDFLPLLRFNEFDAEDWARLAVEAGAGYAVVVARHADGWVWWDAPTTTRTMVTNGPHRNVVAEFAEACERNDLPLGAYYATDPTDVDERDDESIVHDVADLVDRMGVEFLYLDSDGAQAPDDLLDDIRGEAPELLIGTADRCGTTAADATAAQVRTFERTPPPAPLDGPWLVRRDLSGGLGHNRTARTEHHLDAHGIVALLTEVVAKGGHLLLSVGADADGVVSELQTEPLRVAGDWIRRNERLIAAGRPWTTWGDADSRYISLDDVVHAIDVSNRGHFAELDTRHCRVGAVSIDGAPVPFHQDEEGLHIDLHRLNLRSEHGARRVDIPVYRLELSEIDRPDELFAAAPRRPVELRPLLAGVAPGDVVQLGDGTYVGPVEVPEGVTLRGLGGHRTVLEPGTTEVVLARGARLEHLRVSDTDDAGSPAVVVAGTLALVLGCRVDGAVMIRADDVAVRATRAVAIATVDANRTSITRCQITGSGRGTGIHVQGGAGHVITSCELDGHRDAIHVVDATETVVAGNNASARRCGIRLERTEGAEVNGNFLSRTTRGIEIDGGAHADVHGNAVCDGDSGCIVQWGATGCSVTGNTWERCRIGVLAWEAADLSVHGNEAIDLHEPDAAVVTGP